MEEMFFGILSRQLTDFLLKNIYINTLVQKGGIWVVVSQLIREAQEGKGDLVLLWLDLTNAYSSIQHKLVETALDQHHVPSKIKVLILNYFGNLTADGHWLERGL